MTSRRSVEIRQIEQENGYARTSAELFYRLEALVQEGFVRKRRIATDGQFSYALSDEFRRIADRSGRWPKCARSYSERTWASE